MRQVDIIVLDSLTNKAKIHHEKMNYNFHSILMNPVQRLCHRTSEHIVILIQKLLKYL